MQIAGELADLFSELQTFPGDEHHGAAGRDAHGRSQRTGRRGGRTPDRGSAREVDPQNRPRDHRRARRLPRHRRPRLQHPGRGALPLRPALGGRARHARDRRLRGDVRAGRGGHRAPGLRRDPDAARLRPRAWSRSSPAPSSTCSPSPPSSAAWRSSCSCSSTPRSASSSSLAAIGLVIVVALLPFGGIERIFGYCGLLMLVFVATAIHQGPDWGAVAHGFIPSLSDSKLYLYFVVGVFAAALMPYEVHFYSSGAIEEGWTEREPEREPAQRDRRLRPRRHPRLRPGRRLRLPLPPARRRTRRPRHGRPARPGRLRRDRPAAGARRDAVLRRRRRDRLQLLRLLQPRPVPRLGVGALPRPEESARASPPPGWSSSSSAMLIVLTGINPVEITEYSVVFAVVALPMTYLPILMIAGDRSFMGEHANGRISARARLALLRGDRRPRDRRDPAAADDQRGRRMKREEHDLHRPPSARRADPRLRRHAAAGASTTSSCGAARRGSRPCWSARASTRGGCRSGCAAWRGGSPAPSAGAPTPCACPGRRSTGSTRRSTCAARRRSWASAKATTRSAGWSGGCRGTEPASPFALSDLIGRAGLRPERPRARPRLRGPGPLGGATARSSSTSSWSADGRCCGGCADRARRRAEFPGRR